MSIYAPNENFNQPVLSSLLRNVFQKSGDFGVELEIEGRRLPLEVVGWEPKPENSLRGEAVEYVTRGACSTKTLEARMKSLHSKFKEFDTEVLISDRASTHIHLNMQKYSIRDVIGFIILFSALEPLIIRLCGPNRDGNLFCLSSIDTGDLPQYMEYFAKCIDNRSIDHVYNRGKYAALNVDTLRSFGSLEVRCFPNTVDTNQILTWTRWLSNIRKLTSTWPDVSYKTLVDEIYFNTEKIVNLIFPKLENTYALCAPHSVKDMVQIGVETAYEIYKGTSVYILKERKIVTKEPKKKAVLPEEWQVNVGNLIVHQPSGLMMPSLTVQDFYPEVDSPYEENDIEPDDYPSSEEDE